MATLPVAPSPGHAVRKRILSRSRLIFLLAMTVLLCLCLIFSWTTRDAMANLPFLPRPGQVSVLIRGPKTLVELRPWQTAEALAPLAVSSEEKGYAHEAERLADHEVDQAFTAALRQASVQARHRNLTGAALALSQRVKQLEQQVKQDQALVKQLTPASASAAQNQAAQPSGVDGDLEVAQAQLALDSDEMADAQQELDRATGDHRAQLQSELAAHEALMRKHDAETHDDGQVAILSARRHGTLVARLKAWKSQHDRYGLIQQAMQLAQADATSLTAELKTMTANASAAAPDETDSASKLASIIDRSEQRQLLSISNDRIQTDQQLASVYCKWAAQVQLQHRILQHLMTQSLALIFFISICILLADALVRRLMANSARDRRQMQTLRSVLQMAIQTVGVVLILLVVFGWPQQISTIVGLVTAGLTIAMQDFILAFFGWFVLMGKNGIHIGDWVEINGVGGEVIEIGLMSTTLLETGDLAERGHPTGRRISFINSFAIRGKYFNFSTTGQWMWDEITLSIPATGKPREMVERIRKAVKEETAANARVAEKEWKRGARDDGLSRFSSAPVVNLRPDGTNIDIRARYVTRASERFVVRNRLYQRVIDLLQEQNIPAPAVEPPAEQV